jgi:TPR repeat protein
MVGLSYAQGLGVVKDESRAAQWYAAAAAQGDASAQYNLGIAYADLPWLVWIDSSIALK